MLAVLALFALLGAGHAKAQALKPYRAVGFWPDFALTVGGGIGIGHPIVTNVYGALRLGALFAYEPWVINLGINGELGALPRRGVGLELEFNYLRGPFLQLAYDRVADGFGMTRLTLGFALFGVQWQHRLSSAPPDNALLFVLRFPFGIGWFFLQDQRRRQRQPPPIRPIPEPEVGD